MKILIVTKNWLGDILFQEPAIQAVRDRYPQAEIVCITPPRCSEILAVHPAVDRVILFDERKTHRSFFSRLAFAWKLREEKWDQAYLFHRSKTRAFLMWLAGARERFGFDTKGGAFLTRSLKEPKGPVHHADYFLEMLRQLGFNLPAKPAYHFYFSPKDEERAAQILKENQLERFAAFHLGANWDQKRWLPAHFAKLADLIWNKYQLPIVVTGGPEDETLAAEMLSCLKEAKVTVLTGKTRLRETAAVFQKALFVVSGDSGPMHIASGVGARVLALFGPTNPALTGPRGTGEAAVLDYVPAGYTVPWYGKDFPKEGWLSRIQPEKVFETLESKKWIEASAKKSARVAAEKSSRQKILLITLSNIGDVILTTAVLMALKAEFPQSEVTIVVGPRGKGIFEGSRYVSRLIIYDKHASWFNKIRFVLDLRKESYDKVIDLKNSAVPFLVKAKQRSPLIRFFQEQSLRARHLEILKMMGLQYQNTPVFDFYNEADEKSVLRKLEAKGLREKDGWILIAPMALSELKTWKLSGFAEVIERLLKERPEPIVLSGGERERPFIESLVQINPSRVMSLAGEITLREMAVLIARSALLLSNDSSTMHMGYELNVSVAAIFGPTNAEKAGRKGPRFRIVREEMPCSPCEKPQCRFPRQHCLEDLKAEKVFLACKELLDSRETAVKS